MTPQDLPLFARARRHGGRTALVAPEGSFTYDDLMDASGRVAAFLLDGRPDLEEGRVAFLVPPGFDYVAVQWGIWRAGGVAVPLAVSHPPRELDVVLEDAEPLAVVVHPDLADRIRETEASRALPPALSAHALGGGAPAELPALGEDRRAMMIYTSGTTGRPKGVVTTHRNTRAQVESLVQAWEWSPDDRILHVLPLHHVHGIINALTCPLWVGATCEILPGFDADDVWRRFEGGGLTVFMGVPTTYARLLRAWDEAPAERRAAMRRGCGSFRVMVSGSAALPVDTLARWREITGHTLLERYGMTEIGMGLSNPLHGERRPGHVGTPLPGVEARLVDSSGRSVEAEGIEGTIEIRGPGVFLEYWRRPEETARAFPDDGWFRTGDVAVVEDGHFRILGRESVDIIKSGGYKISALEIEEVLRGHPSVADCAVVGVPDDEWGERVCVAVVVHGDAPLSADSLRAWAKERLAPYKAPSRACFVPGLPRNAMGKVVKPRVRELFEQEA